MANFLADHVNSRAQLFSTSSVYQELQAGSELSSGRCLVTEIQKVFNVVPCAPIYVEALQFTPISARIRGIH